MENKATLAKAIKLLNFKIGVLLDKRQMRYSEDDHKAVKECTDKIQELESIKMDFEYRLNNL